MVNEIPTGLVGLIISAIMSAAMSTISSGMNSSATVFSIDIYKRYINPAMNEKQLMKLLYISTAVFGLMGMTTGILMIGIKSILDIWWQLSGIFSGGMLGLFLLGMISRKTQNAEALTATTIGVLVILWMTFSVALPDDYDFLRNMLHSNMIVVIGTLTIFLSGLVLTAFRKTVAAD